MPETDKLDEIIQGLKKSGSGNRESDFVRIFEYFVSSDGIRGKTRITPKKRNMIHVYDLMHPKHPKWGLKDAAENLAQLFISEDGPDNSRKGMVELFRGLLSQLRNESVSIETGKEPPKP